MAMQAPKAAGADPPKDPQPSWRSHRWIGPTTPPPRTSSLLRRHDRAAARPAEQLAVGVGHHRVDHPLQRAAKPLRGESARGRARKEQARAEPRAAARVHQDFDALRAAELVQQLLRRRGGRQPLDHVPRHADRPRRRRPRLGRLGRLHGCGCRGRRGCGRCGAGRRAARRRRRGGEWVRGRIRSRNGGDGRRRRQRGSELCGTDYRTESG
mmetsp:Transcript_66392/g.182107  ORF Transcript_66392/g.182107 Transcript_66392/m.182107 type:complete len:211 (-) Transcript_66392:761-1393(-)